jgi:Fungal specific transcription factor domain
MSVCLCHVHSNSLHRTNVASSTTQWAKPNRQPRSARCSSSFRQVTSEDSILTHDHSPQGNHINDKSRIHVSSTAAPAATASSPSNVSSSLNHPAAHGSVEGIEEFARSGLARFFRHGINAVAWGIFNPLGGFRVAYVGTAVSNLVHLVRLHRASIDSPDSISNSQITVNPSLALSATPPTAFDSAILEDTGTHADQDWTNEVIHYPYPPIRPTNGWNPGPDTWSGMVAHDFVAEVSSFPALEIRDALVAAYFQHIHPFHPVISKPEFLEAYRSKNKPPPLLLFQSVLMAGAHACSHPLVATARHSVKTTLFRRASMLFHMRHETDRAFLMQAAVLFTRQMGDGDTVTGGPWYWSGIAVRIGCGLGMHRHSMTLPPLETSQYRRCWWSAFICEVFSSLETGRPCAVHASDIDQLPPSPSDMTDSSPSTSDPDMRPDFLIQMVKLAYIGLDILALNEPAQRTIIDVHGINARLCHWSLQSGIPSASTEENSWACQLHMHYNLMLLHLHRNLPNESKSQDICSAAAHAIIRALERLMELDCLSQCHFTAVSAVTAAGIQLANEIRSSVTTRSFIVAIQGLESLTRLLKPVMLLAGYWPNAEAVHSVFQEIHNEYRSYVTQGVQDEPIVISDIQPDWYRLLSGAQPAQLNNFLPEWLNLAN